MNLVDKLQRGLSGGKTSPSERRHVVRSIEDSIHAKLENSENFLIWTPPTWWSEWDMNNIYCIFKKDKGYSVVRKDRMLIIEVCS